MRSGFVHILLQCHFKLNLPALFLTNRSGPNFIIKDLFLVLILIIANQISNDSLCCFNKYNFCLCRFIGKLYILFLTFLINLSKICIISHERVWIKLKPDYIIMKLGPEHMLSCHKEWYSKTYLQGHLRVAVSCPHRPVLIRLLKITTI